MDVVICPEVRQVNLSRVGLDVCRAVENVSVFEMSSGELPTWKIGKNIRQTIDGNERRRVFASVYPPIRVVHRSGSIERSRRRHDEACWVKSGS